MSLSKLSRRTFVLAVTVATPLATLSIQRPAPAGAATTAPTGEEAERAHRTLIGLL